MKLIGGILLAIGILIAGLSGLCTFAVIFGGLAGDSGGGSDIFILPLIFGGPPFAVGAALFLLGRAIIRRAKADEAPRETGADIRNP